MAVIQRNGGVCITPRLLEGRGSLIGEVDATLAELTHLFGQDDHVREAPPGWVIRVVAPDDTRVAMIDLYSYKNTAPRTDPNGVYRFSLGGSRGDEWAAQRVTATIEAARTAR